MNKKIKMLTTALLLSGSLLSAAPVHAATTTENQNKKVSNEVSKSKIDGKVTKPSGNITVKSAPTAYISGTNVALRSKAGAGIVYERLNRGDEFIIPNPTTDMPYVKGHYWLYGYYNSENGRIYGYVAEDLARARGPRG